ncbi:RING box protein [Echinococcus multilocularis]|uniref:RING box protein n=1 Tax=Echinococcus multilocularis TaxID=6211 RepID=A0A068Y3A3_ECHMU|nr:RING box protein [Echinococcus multilocularis]
MLWRKRNIQHDSPCPGSPGGKEGGSSDDCPPAPNSPCLPPPPSPPPLPSDEAQLTPQLPKEHRDMEHFQLLKWNACAFWSWDVMHDTCVICRNAMMSLCIHCQAKIGTNPLDEICAVAWGVCNHAYHLHCIKRWLESSAHPRCPLDNSEWEFSMIGQ